MNNIINWVENSLITLKKEKHGFKLARNTCTDGVVEFCHYNIEINH